MPAPDVVLQDPPSGDLSVADVVLRFTSAAADAIFECAVDGAAWTACTSPFTRTYAVGAHTVAVRASTPSAGTGLPVSTSFTVVGPTVTLVGAPSGTVTSSQVGLSFTSDAAGATFECAVDDGGWAACASPASFTLANGSHVLHVRATSSTGTGPVTSTPSFLVDAPGPEVIIDSEPLRRVTASSVTLTFHSDDPLATFECRENGEEWQPCSSPAVFELADGQHVLKVRAVSPLTGPGGSASTGAISVDTSKAVKKGTEPPAP